MKRVEPTQNTQVENKATFHFDWHSFICNVLWFIAWKITDKSWKTGEEVASVGGEPIKRETWMAAMEEEVGRETLTGTC